MACALLAVFAGASGGPVPQGAAPVVQTPLVRGFFARYIDCGGVGIRSSAAVTDAALQIACAKVNMMLAALPQARSELSARGSELHVIGRDEGTSALPEHQGERGKIYYDRTGKPMTLDQRTRGKGGGIYASCGEENLLRLPTDRYRGGQDICVHEFAHTIMAIGLSADQRKSIERQYADSMARGLWRDSYAANNEREFWAELSMWYFGGHGDRRMAGDPPADGREGLRRYDPDAYAVLDEIYRAPSP